MSRRIVLLVAVMIVLTGVLGFMQNNAQEVAAISQFESIEFEEGVVTASNLNLRQGASTEFPIISVLENGKKVQIFGRLSDWFTVYDPESGYVGAVSANYIHQIEASKDSEPEVTESPEEKETATGKEDSEPKEGETKESEPKESEETFALKGISEEEQILIDLINKEREEAGVEPLKLDMELMEVTRLKAKEMVEKNYFSHQSPKHGSPFDMMRRHDIEFKSAGENIAGNNTIEGAVKAWMESEGHKKNILNSKFGYTGVGIVDSPAYGKVIVQHFIGK
ncbi:CAP domain-containing protein [Herbivorax sp. ANBcel31]|uniref:CAP domain-containing protein n=1 Tax=Herbivorax sp. ANBcel31 TaxID=3069754 RepID=UPI0027B5BE64|nr:CAP domain-containing protein [Herbivorax sp. ANBcel31]MDQ2087514.1 CAP domain-containing protein [Herbivorax sp. ANBcel31]